MSRERTFLENFEERGWQKLGCKISSPTVHFSKMERTMGGLVLEEMEH